VVRLGPDVNVRCGNRIRDRHRPVLAYQASTVSPSQRVMQARL
jgi:hypothetical protein